MIRLAPLFLLLFCFLTPAYAQQPNKRIAITLDDLPYAGPHSSLANAEATTEHILRHIKYYGVPVVGFVNEKKLARQGEEDTRLQLLQHWLDAGLELGNHTYSHPSLSTTPLEDYQRDVLLGETLSKPLSQKAGRPFRYFRHPYTHTGPTSEVKNAFENFLSQQGYTIAPFTIESADWMFNYVYTLAKAEADTATMRYVGEEYIRFTSQKTDFFEKLSTEVVGRPIPHIYLAHANALHADYFDELMEMFKTRGYIFISLEEALQDAAYQLPDTYVAPNGPSWLHRWNTKNRNEWLKKEPEPAVRFSELYQQYQKKQKQQ